MPCTFALLSPDCTLSGQTAAAIRFMSERGVTVVAHRRHRLSPNEVAQLYAGNRSSRPSTLLDTLVDELFGLSESVCLLLSSTAKLPDEAFHRLLLDIKGPSDPFNCHPDQLRRTLGATNKILNLIHTSDTPADSLREGALFFGDISCATERVGAIDVEVLERDSPAQPVSASGFRTLNAVKRRLLLSGHYGRDVDAIDHLLDLEEQLLDSQPDQVALFPRLQKMLGQQMSAIASAKSVALRTLMRQLISIGARTTDSGGGHRNGPASVHFLLEQIGIPLSDWEALVIKVEASMAPPRTMVASA
jgi:nucleoside diphosphate kinase